MDDIFNKFKPRTTKHKLKSLDGAEVELRRLTLGESEELMNSSYDGTDENGEPKINLNAASAQMILKVSKVLVNPALTPAEIRSMDDNVMDMLLEINDIVSSDTGGDVDKEGK